jgi:hypothetical protein
MKTMKATRNTNRLWRVAACGVLSAAVAAALPAPAGVTVTAGDITDRRRNDNLFTGLEVELKLTGEAAGGARGARAVVQKATDDTGRSLLKESEKTPDFEKASGDAPPVLKLDLRNPARRATKIRDVSGQVELFVPGRDTASTANVPKFQAGMDKPISAGPLKAAAAELTVVSRKTYDAEKKKDDERKKEAESAGIAGAMVSVFSGLFEGLWGDIGENDVLIKVDDKGKKVFGIDVYDSAGKPIDTSGSMTIGSFRILKFTEKVPPDASLRIYLMTPKSMVTAPFSLKDVALP